MQRPALADYPVGARLPERVLADFELVWMVRGQATITTAKPFVLRPGELLLLPPGVRHGIDWDRTGPSRQGTCTSRPRTSTGHRHWSPAWSG